MSQSWMSRTRRTAAHWQLNGLGLVLMGGEYVVRVAAEICSTSILTKGPDPLSPSEEEGRLSGAEPQTSTSSHASSLTILSKPSKMCPDFKDDADQSACCRSRITQGAFYCCTEEQKAQIVWDEDKEAWRQFFQSHITEFVLASILLAILLCVLMSYLCKRLTFCPMYQPKLFDPLHGASSSRFSGYQHHQTHSCAPNSRYRRAPPTAGGPSSTASAAAAALSAELLSSSSTSAANGHHNSPSLLGTGAAAGQYHHHPQHQQHFHSGATASTGDAALFNHCLGNMPASLAGQHNKPPTLYEAPPTYEFATSRYGQQRTSSGGGNAAASSLINPAQSARQPIVVVNQQRVHDWDCLIENEVNDARQQPPIVDT